jgi:lysophospholipase L1-like esterase
MRKSVRLARWALAAGILLVSAETVSRLDDWLFFDTPMLAAPDRERDLTVQDEAGLHGRPNGRYRKWRLNEYGFRSGDMSAKPEPGVTRVMILGASETFGLYEAEDKEYPAQLARLLKEEHGGRVEVINAAMAGISVRSMLPYWHKWLLQFHPDVVLIYPSPLFYLDEEPPAPPREQAEPEPRSLLSQSRFAGRVLDTLRRTEWIRRLRLELLLYLNQRGRPDDWLFREPPADRLEQFTTDLTALIQAIRADGAKPILVTHAIRATSPPGKEDQLDLKAMQLFFPRATTATMVNFEDEAAQAMRRLGQRENVPVIDAAAKFNGRRKDFADLVHFNDQGAEAFARFLAQELTPMLAR